MIISTASKDDIGELTDLWQTCFGDDDDYIGATTLEHKISVRPAPGAHRLTVIDEHGARQSVSFSCR